jgi:hypothetical protein
MLTRLIPVIYIGIIEITLWLMLLIAGLVGYNATVPLLEAAGWIVANEVIWSIGGATLLVIATFLIAVGVTGPLLVLVDIRRSVKALEANIMSGSTEDLRPDRKEPYFEL